jgi:hypothetical protein
MLPSGVVRDSVGRQRPDQGQTRADQGRGRTKARGSRRARHCSWMEGGKPESERHTAFVAAGLCGRHPHRTYGVAGWLAGWLICTFLYTYPTYLSARSLRPMLSSHKLKLKLLGYCFFPCELTVYCAGACTNHPGGTSRLRRVRRHVLLAFESIGKDGVAGVAHLDACHMAEAKTITTNESTTEYE